MAGGFAALGIADFFADAINAAGDLGETVSKTGQILGEEALPGLEAWAEGAADAFGQSKQLALDGASTFAIFGKSAGLAGDDLVGFSTDLTELSADFASFFNTSPEEAIQAIGAALRGESEPIRRYGILLDDATLRQRAFTLGITDSIKTALTPQQRVLAAQAEIMAQSADAQGDFARTSDGLANQQRILQANLANVTAEIGERLLPVVVDFVTFLNDDAIPVVEDFLDVLSGDQDFNLGQAIEDEFPVEADSPLGRFAAFFNQTWDAILMRENDIRAGAERMGLSYDEMHTRVIEAMDRLGIDHGAAINLILADQQRLATATPIGQFVAENLGGSNHLVDQAAGEMADGIPEAMQDALDEGAAIARQTPGALANELRASIEDYDKALEELTVVAENSVSDLAERQKIEGILASQELTDALNSDSTRTRLLAQDLVQDLVSDYELLAPGAMDAGELVNPSLRSGVMSNIELATAAGEAIVNAAGQGLVDLGPSAYIWGRSLTANFIAGMQSLLPKVKQTSISLGDAAATGIRLKSPAEEGPLSEPADKWGATLGQMFAEGMLRSIPGIHGASLAMAGAAILQGGFGTPNFGAASVAPVGGAPLGGNTINVNLLDRMEVRSPRDIGDGLRILEERGHIGTTRR